MKIARLSVVGRKFSMGLSVSACLVNRETDSLLWNYLLRMLYNKLTNWRRLEIVLLRNREIWVFYQDTKENVFLQGRFSYKLFKRLSFFKLKFPQMGCKPTGDAASTWTISHHPIGFEGKEKPMEHDAYAICCAVRNKVLCL